MLIQGEGCDDYDAIEYFVAGTGYMYLQKLYGNIKTEQAFSHVLVDQEFNIALCCVESECSGDDVLVMWTESVNPLGAVSDYGRLLGIWVSFWLKDKTQQI